MKKRLKTIIPALIMIVLTVFVAWYIAGEKIIKVNSDDIKIIKVSSETPLFGEYYNCIIDFSSNTVTETGRREGNEYENTNHFSDEDKENFVVKANEYGFFNWKESYLKNISTNDSTMHEICITYTDDSKQYISYQQPGMPPAYEYDEMTTVFLKTFGCLI